MDQTVVDAFWSVRNAVVAGAVWLLGLYLVTTYLVTTHAKWSVPMADPTDLMLSLLDLAGPFIVGVAVLVVIALVGSAILKVSGRVWLHAHRRVLTFLFSDVTSSTALHARLKGLSLVGRATRAFSSSALTAFYTYLSTREPGGQSASGPALTTQPRYFNRVLHHMLWSAPALLEGGGLRYAEQQRTRARAELVQALVVGAPLLLAGVIFHLYDTTAGFWVGVLSAAVLMGYLVWDAQTAWRDAYSQILHGVIELELDPHLPPESWDVSKHANRSICAGLWRVFVARGPRPDLSQYEVFLNVVLRSTLKGLSYEDAKVRLTSRQVRKLLRHGELEWTATREGA